MVARRLCQAMNGFYGRDCRMRNFLGSRPESKIRRPLAETGRYAVSCQTGSMGQKVQRMEKLAGDLSGMIEGADLGTASGSAFGKSRFSLRNGL